MSSLLLEQTTPGATLAIVVGRAADDFRFARNARYRAVMWFVDAERVRSTPSAFASCETEAVVLEETDVAVLPSLLEKFALRDGRALPDVYVTSDVTGRLVEGYAIVVDGMHTVFESLRRSRQTRQEEGFLWQKHFLLNLPDFVRRRLPASWAGALRGYPAFVCGAGPSLDVSVALLARHADRGIVFAADSALRALARHGVQADFAVSVDATKPPEKCLPDDLEPSRVVLAGISPSSWREREAEFRLLFLSGRNLTERWLAACGVSPTPVAVAENCGITAFELARFLGCSPIHLFGMDMAADASNPQRRHTADSDPTIERGSGFAAQTTLPMVPGNYAEEVPTFLFGEWRGFNERLASLEPGRVVNINDRGARLANTTLMHPGNFAFACGADGKRRALALLGAPTVSDADNARIALAELGAQGTHGCREIAGLRRSLECDGVDALVVKLRMMFADEKFGRAMGPFALKVMPHLTPPVEGDAMFWNRILDELEELCCLAEGVYEAPLV